MFQTLRLWWYYLTGQNDKYKELLARDKNVIGKVYDQAIKGAAANRETLLDVIATMNGGLKDLEESINVVAKKIQHWTNVRDAAALKSKSRAQVVISECKQKGITDPDAIKVTLNNDPEYLKHQGVFNDVSSSIKEATPDLENKQTTLKTKQADLLKYQQQYQKIDRTTDKLSDEKENAQAKIAYANQVETINAKVKGLSNNSVDADLSFVREVVKKADARANTLNELSVADAETIENEYADYANKVAANHELDKMLDIDSMINGDTTKELNPVKLPE